MIDFTSITRISTRRYLYEWSAVNTPFHIYSNGVELFGSEPDSSGVGFEDTSIALESTDALEPPAVEVLDSTETDEPLNYQFPPFVRIQWRGDINADHYLVQKFVSGAWATQRRFPEKSLGYYTFDGDEIADGAHQYRVLAVDPYDNQSTARTMDINFAGIPLPPSISLSYDDGTGDLTVAAR